MARTRQEIRDFLNSQVGQSVNAKAGRYKGQCVSLIKALFEFLGVNDPYGARGDAKDAGDTYVRQGIAANGSGWLNVCVNRDMGRLFVDGKWQTFGHIWLDLSGEANFEQNGAKALTTTKGTRPIQQAQQIINLDRWVAPEAPRKSNEVIAKEVLAGAWGNGDDRKNRLQAAGYDYNAIQAIVNKGGSAPAPVKQSNETIANQVIAGAWGTGEDRKKRLAAAGYDYNAVQAIVNQKMGQGVSGRKSDDQVANEVIAGKWGKGDERKQRLAAAGYNYGTIQALVNRKLGF